MASNIEWDDKSFQEGVKQLIARLPQTTKKAVHDIATEILRLSNFEVPHDTGLLQTSGMVEDGSDESIVGYNKVYAARLHEHPEYRFQKGRKGKYLEDPIKNNMSAFIDYAKKAIADMLK